MAGSLLGRRFSQVWWLPESHSTVDMQVGRVTELQETQQTRVAFWFFAPALGKRRVLCRRSLSFTCCLLKHAARAVHPPVLGQLLGRHLTLHPALVCLSQGLIHAGLPPVGGLRPVGRRLFLDCRVVQDLRLSQSGEEMLFKKAYVRRLNESV